MAIKQICRTLLSLILVVTLGASCQDSSSGGDGDSGHAATADTSVDRDSRPIGDTSDHDQADTEAASDVLVPSDANGRDTTSEDAASKDTAGGDDTGGGVPVTECANAPSDWIWCDDFEKDRLSSYFEYDDADGRFDRTTGVGVSNSNAMKATFAKGKTGAGNLHLAFGDTPSSYFDPVDNGTTKFRELYWRVYVRHESSWTGGGGHKLSRATIFVDGNWAQAMIAHVWSGSDSPGHNYLVLDPASGTDESGNLQTTTYNDFSNLRWLGAKQGKTPLFDSQHVGDWYCVEAHVRLNDAQKSNGTFEYWIDGQLEARATGLNWVGDYDQYGLNAVFLENYWNGGAPKKQSRYFDNFVVSTSRIGCGG